MKRATMIVIAALGLAAGGVAWVLFADRGDGPVDGQTVASIDNGQRLYEAQCASCHGANLEGQPNWQTPLASGRLPAPPHDASGHTWHHPDGVLLRITKEGTAAVVGGDYQSDMPGFAGILSDAEIRDILAYIKSTWPERERTFQAEISRKERAAQ